MKLYVYKHPDADTLAHCKEVADDALAPDSPWESMSLEDYTSWCATERANGWVPPAAPALVPEFVRSAQLRQWLVDHDMYSSVETILSSIPDPKAKAKAQQRWEYEINYRRDDPLVNQLGAALGMDSSDIDQAFREAEANYQ